MCFDKTHFTDKLKNLLTLAELNELHYNLIGKFPP